MNTVISQLKSLGDANRFRIAMMLTIRPLCVCELLNALDIAGGTLSNHLKILKNAGLIEQNKDGRWIEYSLANEEAGKFLEILRTQVQDTQQIDADAQCINNTSREFCTTSANIQLNK